MIQIMILWHHHMVIKYILNRPSRGWIYMHSYILYNWVGVTLQQTLMKCMRFNRRNLLSHLFDYPTAWCTINLKAVTVLLHYIRNQPRRKWKEVTWRICNYKFCTLNNFHGTCGCSFIIIFHLFILCRKCTWQGPEV